MKLPGLLFETCPSSKLAILFNNFFSKKRKYWCKDFTDCTLVVSADFNFYELFRNSSNFCGNFFFSRSLELHKYSSGRIWLPWGKDSCALQYFRITWPSCAFSRVKNGRRAIARVTRISTIVEIFHNLIQNI